MRYPDRVTMCVSSQAGCGMACPFCATGQGGLQRNMSTAEIVEQVVAGARSLARGEVPGGPGRVSNVVFMGMGEPLANYKAVIGAVRRLTDPPRPASGMSARGVTVSTVGLVPRINQLTEEGIPVTLALSLHAPDDELRNELVPINTRFSVAETVEAAWNYARVTKRRVSIEYAMMRGINDQAWRADLLGDVLNSLRRLGLGARQPDPAQPDARLEVDRLRPGRRARVRPPARGARASRPPSATPAAARSTAPAASSPRSNGLSRRRRSAERRGRHGAQQLARPRRRCRRGARAAPSRRPRASARSSGHAGTVSVQYVAADQHHRRDRRLVGVVVLAGVLEDLLHGAAGAGQEDDAGVADLEQDRLAGGVAEVLRDRGGEHVGRLVAVVPGRDAQRLASVRAARRAPSKRRVGPGVDRRAVRRHRGQRGQRRVEVVARRGRRAGRRGWPPPSRPGPPPVATTCARAEQPARAGPRRRTPASPRCSAWPPITPTRCRPAHPRRQRLVDRVVVQRLGEQRLAASAAACDQA